MPSTTFIDVVGDDRIDAILSDPANLAVSAFRAEAILDWIPDTGQYAGKAGCRMHNGLFRTPALAASGIPAVLRQRFYDADVIRRMEGTRFVGLVIYDSEHDDYAFTLSAGADVIGVVRPWRHDNRRHLLIVDEPATGLKPYIPFGVQADGTGPCYLEHLVFLPQRPAPSSFAPGISRVTAKVTPGQGDAVDVTTHLITAEASKVTVTARVDGRLLASGGVDAYEKLHAVQLPRLPAHARYTLEVTAVERGGATEQAQVRVDAAPTQPPAVTPLTVPVEICSTSAAPAGLPLTFGLPLPEGRVWQGGAGWMLHSGNATIPLQARATSHWPDGSARWVLLDGHCPAFGAQQQILRAEVRHAAAQPGAEGGLRCEEGCNRVCVTGDKVRVTAQQAEPRLVVERLDGGTWRLLFEADAGLLGGQLANGACLTAGPVTELALEEAGPERAVVRLCCKAVDERGVGHFDSDLRIHVYRNQPFVRLSHRLMVVSPTLGAAFAGPDVQPSPLLELAHLGLHFRPGAAASDCIRIYQPHDRDHCIERSGAVEEAAGRWTGPLCLPNGFVLCPKDFWQTYPKALAVGPQSVRFDLFPELDERAWPEYAEEWWRVYFWLDPTRRIYRLKVGMAFTADLLIGDAASAEEAQRWQDWLNAPAFVRPEIGYLNATGALLPIGAKADSRYPRYEAMMDQGWANWLACREANHHYGFANLGDTYNEGEGWANNEYDGPFAHALEFLRGGRSGWALLATQAARHMADIDTCNFSPRAEDVGRQYTHMQGHVGHFLPPLFRSKLGAPMSQPSHSWIEGLALLYAMTGDETLGAAARRTAELYTGKLSRYDFNNMRECGWHLIHLCGMARLSTDPRYLNAAAIIVERVLEQQEPGGGWEHPLSEAHCCCPPPRCRGEAGFMVGVLLSGLRRYYELNPDPRVAAAIVGGARWLVRRTFVPEAGLFRYTSCATQAGPKVAYTVMVVEALADAALFTDDASVRQALEASLRVIGAESLTANAPRYGKDLLVETRYIPTMLAALQHMSSDRE